MGISTVDEEQGSVQDVVLLLSTPLILLPSGILMSSIGETGVPPLHKSLRIFATPCSFGRGMLDCPFLAALVVLFFR